MQSFFSSDGSFLLQFLVVFLVILVLLMGAVFLFRRLIGRGMSLSSKTTQRGRQPRLGIVDIYELDRARQLILLRRDNVEHLLLVGGPNDVVIERNIQRGAGTRLGPELIRPELAPDAAPGAEGEGPSLDSPQAEQSLFAEPVFAMPTVVETPPPSLAPKAAQPEPPLPDQGLFVPEPPAEEASTPQSRTRAALSTASRVVMRRTPPPLVTPKLEPASERQRDKPDLSAADSFGPPPVLPPGEKRPVDPAVLSDMARQLQDALRRPSSAVTPAPARQVGLGPALPTGIPPAPDSSASASLPGPDPIAAGMAASQALNPTPSPEDAPARPNAPESTENPAAPVAASKPAPPLPPKPAPLASKPEPGALRSPAIPVPPPAAVAGPEKPAELAADPKPAAPQPGAAPASPNPFSVEEIEAEFARLLGRPIDKKN
ncbi:hypothetical protein MMB17_00330 [Methylobacterium organophilum]|uniref:hypothetical protein n=1 Tax=Methylobacterium organophilum TaxID=410 RepID=UPI001F142FFE|nr:hypothetical protein [Methylobacterium organophilum]UMY17849.1 hypothetical protein MMB17_00330 [Methylobacterium organophilum]